MPEPAAKCPGEEALAEFAAGALSAAEVAGVEAHLDGCVDCSWLVGRLIGDRPTRDERSAPPPPASLVPEVQAAQTTRYRLHEVVGAGGMGTVYEAEDVRLGRRLALKLLREDVGGEASSRSARFLREARITAMLEHPNIVPVLELGELEDGVPFYTQRLVRGRSLAKALQACADLPARLALLPHFLDLCHAIAYAHGRGVVHRDIKPGNVMVGPFGETVVVDWGLARVKGAPPEALGPGPATPAKGVTAVGQALGTPGYMSPEQAAGLLDRVDERSDVFSLGAVLFELLVGRPPFTGRSNEEVLRQAISGPMPVAAGQGVPPDLAAVAAKALSRDPALRYPDAAAMGRDVAAWSSGRLVGAYHYSALQRLQRTLARHRLATVSALITLLVAGSWLGSLWGRRVEQQHQRADELLARAVSYTSHGVWDRAATYLASARVARDLPQARWGLAFIGWSGPVPLYKLRRHAGPVRATAFSPDGKVLATSGDDRTLRVYEATTGLERLRVELAEAATALAFTPDGATLACAVGSAVELWSVARGAREAALDAGAPVSSLALSPDGRRAVAAAGSELRVWDLAARVEVARTRAQAPVASATFLAGGEVAFGGTAAGGLRRWSPDAPGEAPALLGRGDARARRLIGCGEARLIVLDDHDNTALWTLAGSAAAVQPLTQSGDCRELVVDAACRTLACVVDNGRVQLLDPDSRVLFATLAGSSRKTTSGALSVDGTLLALGSGDHAVRLWSLADARVHAGARGRGSEPSALAWSADGKLLVSADRGGGLQLWDPATGRAAGELAPHPGGAFAVAFPGAAGPWASAGADGVRLWGADRALLRTLSAEPTTALAFDPSGSLLAAGRADGALRLFSLPAGGSEVLAAHRGAVRALAFSPDGARFASAGPDGGALLWSTAGRRLLARLEGHEDEVRTLAFSPDGSLLVTGSHDRSLRLWSAAEGRPLGSRQGDRSGEIEHLTFAPRARGAPAAGFLLAASAPATLELWDLAQTAPLLTSGGPLNAPVQRVAFSPDARRAALLRSDGALLLRDLSGVERLGSPEGDLAALMAHYKYTTASSKQPDASPGDLVRDEEALRPPAER